MTLTKEQIQSVTFGVAEIYFDEAGAHFYRIRKEQCAHIHAFNSDFGMKSTATAGVRLDFYTDSEYFSFAYTVKKGSSRTFYNFALYIDGKPYALYGENPATKFAGEYAVTLPTGNKRITLFLPCLFSATLTSVALSNGASITPFTPAKRFIFHGDSITHGYDAFSPANCYANRLALFYGAEIYNYAIGGATFDTRMLDEANVPKSDAVFVAYGTNDWKLKGSFEEFSNDCDAFFQKLVTIYTGVPVFAILPIWRNNYAMDTNTATFAEIRAEVARLAQKYGARVIDLWDTIPQDLAFFSDGLHPNDEGFVYYANGVKHALQDIFTEKTV